MKLLNLQKSKKTKKGLHIMTGLTQQIATSPILLHGRSAQLAQPLQIPATMRNF